ncbi:MAG: pilus assembly protein PilM [Desulfobacterales bacterium]
MISRLNRKIMGLDIRSDSISAVSVKSTLKGPCLEYVRHIPLGDGSPPDPEDVQAALASIVSEIDIEAVNCRTAFSVDHLFIRSLSVPFKEEKKIRRILPIELETLVPYQPDDLVTDFITSNTSPESGVDLIAAGMKRQSFKTFLEGLQAAGIDPESISISGYAAAALLAEKGRKKNANMMLIDVEMQQATLYFIAYGRITSMRRFPVPENPDEKAARIADRIRQTLPALTGSENVQPFFITETASNENAIGGRLETCLSVPVRRLDLQTDTTVRLLDAAPSFPPQAIHALALCLAETEAVRLFNFRKGSFAPRNFWVEHTADIIRSSVFAGAVLVLLLAGYIIDIQMLGNRVNQTDRQIRNLFSSVFPDETISPDPLGQMKVKIRDEKKPVLFDQGRAPDIRTIDLLNDISRLIPKELDVVVNQLVVNPGNVIVSGTTDTFNSVDDMKNRLERADLFTSVTITSANLERSGNRVDFKLKIQTG